MSADIFHKKEFFFVIFGRKNGEEKRKAKEN